MQQIEGKCVFQKLVYFLVRMEMLRMFVLMVSYAIRFKGKGKKVAERFAAFFCAKFSKTFGWYFYIRNFAMLTFRKCNPNFTFSD